jgi:redox-sensitive bicupin YhaK (pirin superfamily)
MEKNGVPFRIGPGPWPTRDPFLFCVYHQDYYPEGTEELGPNPVLLQGRPLGQDFNPALPWRMYHGQTIPGFPYHPHCGFETITIVNSGFCDHADSLGAAGRFGEGDVQWMTAGSGVQHSEMFPLLNQDAENPLELFQIWLNLPAKSKQADPHFKMLWHEEIPKIEIEGGSLRLIAGKWEESQALNSPPDSWASEEGAEVRIADIRLAAGAQLRLPKGSQAQGSLFLFEGDSALINGKSIEKNQGIHFDQGSAVEIKASGELRLLLLQGSPIGEAVVQQGPFVTNSPEEMQKAFENYRLTQFGGWPWRHADPVHQASEGRFALYPDGSKENP